MSDLTRERLLELKLASAGLMGDVPVLKEELHAIIDMALLSVSEETLAALQAYAVARGVHCAHIADEDADDKGADREIAHRHFARLAERDLWHLIDENLTESEAAEALRGKP